MVSGSEQLCYLIGLIARSKQDLMCNIVTHGSIGFAIELSWSMLGYYNDLLSEDAIIFSYAKLPKCVPFSLIM